MLPTTLPQYELQNPSYIQRRPSGTIPLIIRRLWRFPQMDFEFALWQMLYLLIAPRRVYRNVYYHKQTKNQWARDDPAFLVLLSGCISVSAIAWGLVYGTGFLSILKMILFMVLIDFVTVGAIVATFNWFVTNRFLTHRNNMHTIDQRVEWAYAFDVHCNAFFPLFLALYVVQFVFMPLLVHDNFVAKFVGNSMYLVAIVYYLYITFLGYNGPVTAKQVEALLAINAELMRLVVLYQGQDWTQRPEYSLFTARIQGNLTFLAGMADIVVNRKQPLSLPKVPDISTFPTHLIQSSSNLSDLLDQAQQAFAKPSPVPSQPTSSPQITLSPSQLLAGLSHQPGNETFGASSPMVSTAFPNYSQRPMNTSQSPLYIAEPPTNQSEGDFSNFIPQSFTMNNLQANQYMFGFPNGRSGYQ
ncbi:hypothetical protein BZG36_00815 [Bifiguratus adelaidae]|uniref:Uncharacterized protein n=1 Tax=Bifiguratus adelaidae TaxID=1938954 RepID=A0A261Y6Q8_9FUNG|nr:hypothetical protein BZG36_00815 [Bifiguratus adelaidae]